MYPPSWRCIEQPENTKRSCKSNSLESSIRESGAAENAAMKLAFDDELHYFVRDNYLNNNALGRKFRDYYYYFSDLYIADNDMNLSLKTMNALLNLNTQLRKLQDESGRFDSEEFLNDRLSTEIKEIMSGYKDIYSDYYTELLMRDFLNDMETLLFRKTVGEVRQLFK